MIDYYEKYHHLFTASAWCPLFGPIPASNELPKYDPLGELCVIIRDARTLLWQECLGLEYIDCWFSVNYPPLEEILKDCEHFFFKEDFDYFLENYIQPDYTPTEEDKENLHKFIFTVRDITKNSRCIHQYSAETELGTAIEGRPLQLFIEKTIYMANTVCEIQAPGFMIFAALAIHAANLQIHLLIMDDKLPNCTKSYAYLRVAEKIVASLHASEMSTELAEKALEIETAKPLVKIHKKQISGFKNSNKNSRADKEKRIEICRKQYYEILNEKKERGLPNKDSCIADKILLRIKTKDKSLTPKELDLFTNKPITKKTLQNYFSSFK